MITLKKATAQDLEHARKKNNSKRLETIECFYQMNNQYAEIVLSSDEQKFRTDSITSSLRNAARRSGLPVKVAQRGKKIFLIRTDM